jgi:hypothetical protein
VEGHAGIHGSLSLLGEVGAMGYRQVSSNAKYIKGAHLFVVHFP